MSTSRESCCFIALNVENIVVVFALLIRVTVIILALGLLTIVVIVLIMPVIMPTARAASATHPLEDEPANRQDNQQREDPTGCDQKDE